jgi:hypothetical protein
MSTPRTRGQLSTAVDSLILRVNALLSLVQCHIFTHTPLTPFQTTPALLILFLTVVSGT